MKSLVLDVGAIAAVVSTNDAKGYLKVTSSDDDNLIDDLVRMATTALEDYLNLSFLSQTWMLTLDAKDFGGAVIELPRSPCDRIFSITTFDPAGDDTALDVSNYELDQDSRPGRVYLKKNGAWPTDLRTYQSVEISYRAGKGSMAQWPTGEAELIQTAVKMLVASYYDNRSGMDVTFATIPAGSPAKALIKPMRVITLL